MTLNHTLIPGPRYNPNVDYTVALALFDIDNTLIKDGASDVPTKRFKNAVRTVQKTIKVSVVSARPLTKAIHIIKYIGADGLAILSNGAQIYDCHSKMMVAEWPLKQTICTYLLNELENLDITYWINDDGIDYFPIRSPSSTFARQENIWDEKSSLIPTPQYSIVKPLVIVAHAVTMQIFVKINTLISDLKDKTIVSFIAHEIPQANGDSLYDIFITHKHANKSDALREVAKRERLHLRNCMVVGDGRNDVGIIATAGIGIAMGNAANEALEAATFIAPRQCDDGAAIALEYFARQNQTMDERLEPQAENRPIV